MNPVSIDELKTPAELFKEAQRYGLDNDPKFNRIFNWLKILPNDVELYSQVMEMLESAKSDNIYIPDLYRATSPYEQSQLAGEIIFGKTPRELIFGLDIEELKRHIIIVGSSGSGKSSIMKLIASQLLESSYPTNTIIFAEKMNFRPLISVSNETVVIPSKYLALSILRNPTTFELEEWLNVITPFFGGFDLRFPGINYIRSIVEESNKKSGFTGLASQPCPTLKDLLWNSYSKKLRLFSERQKYKERAEDRLASIIRSTGKIFTYNYGLDLNQLLTRNVVIELYGLYPAIKRLVISAILAFVYFSKLTSQNSRWTKHICIMIDEGQEVFRRSLELNELMPFTDRFVSIAREQNISVITGTQVFEDLSLNVRSNSSTKIACGFSDKIEQSRYCHSIGITDRSQIKQLDSELSPGRALVVSHKYPHPFLIDVPFCGLEQSISNRVILERLLRQADSIYHKNDVERIKLDLRAELGIVDDSVISLPYIHKNNGPQEESMEEKPNRKENSKDYDETFRLMKYIVSNKKQFLFYSDQLREIGITSGSKSAKIKKTAITLGWVKEHRIQIRRNQQVILELLAPAYKIFKAKRPTFHSKGGFLHQFLCEIIVKRLKESGYKVRIEYFLSNNKAIDIVASKDEQLLFIEIAVSKLESEQNIIADLSTPLQPTILYICCKDSKLRNKQNDLLKSSPIIKQYQQKIRVCLAGEILGLN